MNTPTMIAPMTASNAIMPLESLGWVDTDAPAVVAFEPWLVVLVAVTDVTLEEAALFVSVLGKDGAAMDLRTNVRGKDKLRL